MNLPLNTRIMRGDVDITQQVKSFDICTYGRSRVDDTPPSDFLTLNPPMSTEDISIFATYDGQEYPVYPRAKEQ